MSCSSSLVHDESVSVDDADEDDADEVAVDECDEGEVEYSLGEVPSDDDSLPLGDVDDGEWDLAPGDDTALALPPAIDALQTRYEVRGLPTVLLFDVSGREVRRVSEFVPAPQMLGYLRAVR